MAATRDSIDDIWGPRTPYEGAWPERLDSNVHQQPEKWVQSACVFCSNGCGVDIGVKDGRIVGVRGRGDDRVNRGRLGPKGLHGWVANHSRERLLHPLIRRHGKLEKATWDEAMDLLAGKTREVMKKHNEHAIGIYNSGQLFLEEYYTLAVIAKAGLRTSHLDGNTRLCTATAANALIESFGTDGQPGSYADFDIADSIFMVGHNMAATQTVLWSRILDRLAGRKPPRLIVVDPRETPCAKAAEIHLAPKAGTNVALLNGILHLVIESGHIDAAFIQSHTVGFEGLKEMVKAWDPRRTQEVTGVPAEKLRAAAHVLGTSPTLVSTALQGVYQSNQATAAAVQINNLHLIRGMIGKPGCAPFQFNGQPTAQNTRECGANGEMGAFRNWNNPDHIEELARLWNVDPDTIPHETPPTHAMEMIRYIESGSILLFWVICTNPAVSLPELSRIRHVLGQKDLFLVVQDAFLTETARMADLVLPAAIWGEKTGCFTNVDRTVHISHKAVDPPGEARPDLEILLEYARRMGFQDKDGNPLIKWSDPAGAFDAFKESTRGRPCDYTGLDYAKLTGSPGIQWPCHAGAPKGTERLYVDGVFNTAADKCEAYGHDLATGAAVQPSTYKAADPKGKAHIKAADYVPPPERPDGEYPFWLSTGRVIHHFHTRTKTGRSPELNGAAPDAFVQIAEADARRLGVSDGSILEVETRRGRVRAPARVGDILEGHLFIPFHYGYWDAEDGGRQPARAANELTVSAWDPVSKQPYFKFAAARVRKA
jgi:ferredoxin-nitrate reductase